MKPTVPPPDRDYLFRRLIEHLPGAAALFDLRGGPHLLECNHYWRDLYPEPPEQLWRSLPAAGRYRLLRGLQQGETQFALCLERPDCEWVTLTVLNRPEEVRQRQYLAVQIEPVQHPHLKPLGHNLMAADGPACSLDTVISSVPVMYWRSDHQGRVIACNTALCQRRGVDAAALLGLDLEEMAEGFRFRPLEPSGDAPPLPEAEAIAAVRHWLRDPGNRDLLVTAVNADTSNSTEVWRARPIRDHEGRLLFSHWVGYDLSRYLNLLETQQRLLRRQQVLNRELMHRVKNNLNTVCSLLNLYRHNQPEAGQVLALLQQKILAIGLINDHLDPLDGDRLLLVPYLQDLLASLEYPTGRRPSVSLELPPPPSPVIHPDQGLPVALILQELLTTWATQATAEQSLRLSLSVAGADLAIALTLPLRNGTLLVEQCPEPGRQILLALIRQLQGELRQQEQNGLETVTLLFPRSEQAGV